METVQKTLVTVRVMIIALIGGLLVISGVMIYMVWQVAPGGFIAGKGPAWGGLPLLTSMLGGISVVILLIALPLASFITQTQVNVWKKKVKPLSGAMNREGLDRRDEPGGSPELELSWLAPQYEVNMPELLMIFQSGKMIAVALCEGAGMLCAVAYLLEGYWVALACVGAAIFLMALQVPSKASLSNWLREQMEKVGD